MALADNTKTYLRSAICDPSASTEVIDNLEAVEGISAAELGLLDSVTAGTGAASKVMSLDASADYYGPNNGGIVVGHTAQLTVAGVVPELQVLGTTTAVDGSMALVTASTTNAAESQLVIGKVGNAALGSFTTVAQSENLGSIAWVGDDGTDLATVAARIRAVVNASGTVAASRVPTDLVFYNDPGGADDAIAETARISAGGILFLNDTTDANLTRGICLNQGASDDGILSLKSSDCAHGITDLAETDSYALFKKFVAADGGLQVTGFSDAKGSIAIYGASATEDTTDAPTTSSEATLVIRGAIKSGTGVAAHQATGNLLNVQSTTVNEFIVKGDGELYSNQSATVGTFDEYNDALACADLSYVLSHEYGKIIEYGREAFRKMGIISDNTDGTPGGMYSVTKTLMLAICAIGQLNKQMAALATQVGVDPKALTSVLSLPSKE